MSVAVLVPHPTLEAALLYARRRAGTALDILWVGAGNRDFEDNARALMRPGDTMFQTPDMDALPAGAMFDLIFAFSVLCRWPGTRYAANIAEIYPFEQFTETCGAMDARLSIGGVLAVYNANYRFADAPMSKRYHPIEDPAGESGEVRKFKPGGARMLQRPYPHTLFRKLRDASEAESAELAQQTAARLERERAEEAGRDMHRGGHKVQTLNSTKYDRYPGTFADVARRFVGQESVRALSFGCSSGEECVSLADLYFKGEADRIVGVDVNAEAIAKAHRDHAHERVTYYLADDKRFADEAPFDAIFAMSVLCLWPDTKDVANIASLFPFKDFVDVCAMLDKRLKVGGILVLYNTNYRFTDTPLGRRYEAFEDPSGRSGFVRKFKPDGSRLSRPPYPYTIFRKVQA